MERTDIDSSQTAGSIKMELKNVLLSGLPCGRVAKAPRSQYRGPRFDPYSGNWIPRAIAECSHAATKNWYSQINK